MQETIHYYNSTLVNTKTVSKYLILIFEMLC